MPGGLPEGLVTTTDSVGEEIGNEHRVDLEQVARLWRDYSTSKALLQDRVGDRLANFFWRIWSNPNIYRAISGETVARLFFTMSEGRNLVRTTPVPSPRSTTPVSHGETTPTPSSPQTNHKTQSSLPKDATSASPSTVSTRPPPGTALPLPPILKKASSGSKVPTASAQFHISATGEDTSPGEDPLSPASETLSPLSPASPPAMERTSSSGGKKRANVVTAGGARAKTRPSVGKRKSSQGTTSAVAESKKSPRLPPKKSPPRGPVLRENQTRPGTLGGARHPPPGLPLPAISATSFALPSTSSWQDVSSPTSSRTAPGTAPTSQQPSSWLVDNDFRNKFVQNQRTASQSNLSSLAKSRSIVRFSDELPERPSRLKDFEIVTGSATTNKGKEPRRTNFSTSPEEDANSDDDRDDAEEAIEEGEPTPLPRTKSQLSLMIDHERKRSRSYEIGQSPLNPNQPPKPGAKSCEKGTGAQGGEDDLLTMGRRDGVTKAGGLSINARGKQRTQMGLPEELGYQSPPTPPLY